MPTETNPPAKPNLTALAVLATLLVVGIGGTQLWKHHVAAAAEQRRQIDADIRQFLAQQADLLESTNESLSAHAEAGDLSQAELIAETNEVLHGRDELARAGVINGYISAADGASISNDPSMDSVERLALLFHDNPPGNP